MNSINNVSQPILSIVRSSEPEQVKSVSQKTLINKLNYINFQDRTILINFKHTRYKTILSLPATPLPCAGDRLSCLWSDPSHITQLNSSYSLHNLTIADGNRLLEVVPELLGMDERTLEFILPKTCIESFTRSKKRHACSGVVVQASQNGVMFNGQLRDFTPSSMRVDLTASSPDMLQLTSLEDPLYLSIFVRGEILYSGECRIIRHDSTPTVKTFVLEPLHHHIRRFKPKKYRSNRQKLVPSPSIVFKHPFTANKISLKTIDISGTGFSVDEDPKGSVLLPGMILPEIEVSFGGSSSIRCKAQVVYRNTHEDEDESYVRCGLAFLDMEIGDHVKLLSYLQQAENQSSYICPSVDMDALWRFFFDVGFIYPDKYAHFEANKKEIKQTYKTLYEQHPQICHHFIHQEKGAILAHMGMIRFFENAWLIQHHAANKSESMKAGLNVLNQIGRFINDSGNLYSAHMKYVICYFRPDNKFPNRVFGGMSRHANDKTVSSVDTFAYFHFKRSIHLKEVLPASWRLEPTQPKDLAELEIFYKHTSGGLMLEACDLKPGTAFNDSISPIYQQLVLKKNKQLLSLKKEGILSAVIIVNISDIGLNMSNLTNCPTFIVLDDDLPQDILTCVMTTVSASYEGNEMPVLMFPAECADKCTVEGKKSYNLWILNTQTLDHYFGFLERLIKSIAL